MRNILPFIGNFVPLLLGFALAATSAVHAAPSAYDFSTSGQVLMQADEVTYDTEADIVVAQGNVEVARGERVLTCDKLIYDRPKHEVRAEGNVSLMEADGNVTFASAVTLDEDLANGVVEDLGVLLADDSRMAAYYGERHDGKVSELQRAVFTPCKVCKDPGGPPPLWRIRAFKVVHDQERKKITYEDAYLDFMGVPVFYTPYLSHSDPSIKRKTGLLAPSVGNSSDLGFMAEIPVFWNINPTLDLTVRPVFFIEENPLLKSTLRQRLKNGQYELELSGTYVDKRNAVGAQIPGHEFRGHIFGRGRFAFAETWYSGFNLELTTDDTYLRRYDIFNETRLQTDVYAERFWGRNSLLMDSMWFQGLRVTDIRSQIPYVAPLIRYTQYFDAPGIGGQIELNTNALVLEREVGVDARRLSTQIEWSRQLIAPLGNVFEPKLSVRGDVYHTDNVPDPVLPGLTRSSDVTARGQPMASLLWRWPFMRAGRNVSQLIEPIAQVIYRPEGGNRAIIPNEDSLAFEFGEDNLFEDNKLPGIDRWEDGSRFNFGLHAAMYGASGGAIDMLLGQSYSISEETSFGPRSGLEDRRSDYVGRFIISPHPDFSLTHRFRLDKDTRKIEKNQVDIRSALGPVSLEGTYARLEQTLSPAVPTTREELAGEIGFDFLDYWHVAANLRRDIILNRTVQNGASIGYTDECFTFEMRWIQDFTVDRDAKPANGFFVKLVFDHLG